MKKNRKKQAHVKVLPTSLAGLVMLGVGITLVYWMADSKFNQLGQEVQRAEQMLSRLTDECMRENALWNESITPERLDRKLAHFGLDMKVAELDQIVWLDGNGQVEERQASLLAFRQKPKTIEEGTALRIKK